MAKVLFFLELLVGLVVVPFWPGVDHGYAVLGVVLLGLVLVLTFGAVMAVHGVRKVVQAVFDAWYPSADPNRSTLVWALASAVFPVAGGLGGLIIVAAALSRLDLGGSWSPALTLGAFCLIWGFLGMLVGSALRRIVGRVREPGALWAVEPSFGVKFGLTPRELATARAVLDGLTYKDTATLLSISPATVKSHILSVYQKTGAGNKIELLRLVEAESHRIHQSVDGPPAPVAPS